MREEGLNDDALLQALDASPDAVVLFTTTAEVVYANDAVTPVFGFRPEELVGRNVAALLHPDDVAVALASVDAFEEQGVRPRTAALMRFRWPDGSYVTLEVNGNPLRLAEGRTLYSMFARRAEERRIMAETIELLAHDFEMSAALQLIFDQWRWPLDRSLSAFVWRDADGVRHTFGDDLPDELTGAAAEIDPASPWARAWKGEDVSGSIDDLPADLRRLAAERDIHGYRIHPVGDDGRVHVVVTLWATATSHPLPVFETRLGFISRLIQLSVRFAEQQRRLRHDAAHDSLTGLANRRTFFSAVRAAHAGLVDGSLAVLYIDLDRFKPVNDRWGHRTGDTVLVEVADRLRASCRDGDVVARLGGDEFGVLCTDCSAEESARVGERVLAVLAPPIDVAGTPVEIGASIGIAVLTAPAVDLPPVDALALRADEALYEAKRAGGRRIVVTHLTP